ncbi:MAG TPA: nitroreductase family protein [Anaerolineales bacterium]|nr:nitroreductase family protein [Anaerolineales bacterium]HNA88417.1 nitroreductase family protein [Anaerolineales bacterium]HNB35496.1 nitroreductase family protein [Anaerolineales bacterium]
MRTRRSIRRFRPDPVPDSSIRNILHTATFAPSAHNRQPWRFVVLTKSTTKEHLSEAMSREFQKDLEKDNFSREEIEKRVARSRERITGAPVVILLCLEMSEMDTYPDRRRNKAEYMIAAQSASNAGMQLLLAAHAEGLGGVWVCSPMFAQETVQKALALSKAWEPQAMFLLGYPVEIPALRERKNIEDISIFI